MLCLRTSGIIFCLQNACSCGNICIENSRTKRCTTVRSWRSLRQGWYSGYHTIQDKSCDTHKCYYNAISFFLQDSLWCLSGLCWNLGDKRGGKCGRMLCTSFLISHGAAPVAVISAIRGTALRGKSQFMQGSCGLSVALFFDVLDLRKLLWELTVRGGERKCGRDF